ncbi:hypothetical protein BDM02DRAFT_3161621 [Thelephora ganbajun]|uniref:Uncharacterized protein n=1 Tax=Thelephora ganbajun TaxID=370292 RepID=A0ACB6ZSJ1_THEGA|nr:hypothetical protein BDM02DRAFT_3161621 [Thelephora ganbajun]
MPSIRVKTSRSFYKTLEEEVPASPTLPNRRARSKSVIEVFSGTSFLHSPDPQSPRPQSHTPKLGGARLSRVSQQISNSSREALPEPPVDSQHRGSNVSYDNTRLWDEDQTEAVIDHLDVIDPQVATMSSLTNAANCMVIPPMSLYSLKPTVVLPCPDRRSRLHHEEREVDPENELDLHIEDVLRKRDRFKRTMKGVWSFVKTPLGFITALYGFAVVFWGAAIVFFLAKFINFHNPDRQGFWVEVSSQVVNGKRTRLRSPDQAINRSALALFTATGVGFIPFRAMDTYRIYNIWYFKRKIRRLRKERGIPLLLDEDDLPDPIYDPNYVQVLTETEQRDLHYHQRQFMRSQTWYRPHGTATHRAFPIDTALIICCCNDGNSFFQIILCGTMWGLNRFERPPWSTGILIPASFLCGIASAIFIWRGGKKTKRVEKVEQFLKNALAAEEKQRASNRESPLISPKPTSRLPSSPLANTPFTASDRDRNEKRVVDSMVIESMIIPRHEDIP